MSKLWEEVRAELRKDLDGANPERAVWLDAWAAEVEQLRAQAVPQWQPMPLPRREGLFWVADDGTANAGGPSVHCYRRYRAGSPTTGLLVWGCQHVSVGAEWGHSHWGEGEPYRGTHWIEVKEPTHPAEAGKE
jgi:hypothetical protein